MVTVVVSSIPSEATTPAPTNLRLPRATNGVPSSCITCPPVELTFACNAESKSTS